MYSPDLAHIHDAGFTAVAEAAAREVLDHVNTGVAVDLGCGGGTLAELLHDRGFEAYGCDVSAAMIELARRRVPEGTFTVADVRDYVIPSADVVTAIGEVFCYACHDDEDLDRILQRVHASLRPGGVFLFDLATTGRAKEPTHAEVAGKDWRVEATATEADGWLTRDIRTWRSVDGQQREAREVHRLRLFDIDDVLQRLQAAGFQAEHLTGYDDHAFQPGWDAFLARPASPRAAG